MPYHRQVFSMFLFCLLSPSFKLTNNDWLKKKFEFYEINYTVRDKQSIVEYQKLLVESFNSVKRFFSVPFKKKFDVFIHPDRKSLDSTWQKDWNMPDFKSECWMVASGIDKRIDIISPRTWDIASCEHKYADKRETTRLITHELVHVYHGQLNASPDFSTVENVDWFVEGLATYASGQCDAARLQQVKQAINNKTSPQTLDKFWTGKFKYGFSGSVVMFIDKKYGRQKLKELLRYNKKQEILDALETTEENLLSDWEKYIKSSGQ